MPICPCLPDESASRVQQSSTVGTRNGPSSNSLSDMTSTARTALMPPASAPPPSGPASTAVPGGRSRSCCPGASRSARAAAHGRSTRRLPDCSSSGPRRWSRAPPRRRRAAIWTLSADGRADDMRVAEIEGGVVLALKGTAAWADDDNPEMVTRIVNGGLHGLDDRRARTAAALMALTGAVRPVQRGSYGPVGLAPAPAAAPRGTGRARWRAGRRFRAEDGTCRARLPAECRAGGRRHRRAGHLGGSRRSGRRGGAAGRSAAVTRAPRGRR